MKNKNFVVRKALKGDIPDILRITKEVFQVYKESAGIEYGIPALFDTYEHVEQEIERKVFLVATIDDIVVGSVRVEINNDGTAYLSRFGVESSQQKNGVGAVLIDAVDEVMKELGIEKLYLHTASKVLLLIRFYYGRGFYIDSTTKDRGYIRALLCKEYEATKENSHDGIYSNCAV
ncbi:MAG: GNAT family N-acetyltransferase [Clostridiaceae bacterium]|nr:GNAT family N-acetyltransferase [Clostridiaceae bacterium]